MQYDQFRVLAASMLDVIVPAQEGKMLTPESRAVLEDLCPKPATTCGPRG